jgi:hypothetical protein
MHDPWEGYDKKFSDYYSLGQIREIGALVKWGFVNARFTKIC